MPSCAACGARRVRACETQGAHGELRPSGPPGAVRRNMRSASPASQPRLMYTHLCGEGLQAPQRGVQVLAGIIPSLAAAPQKKEEGPGARAVCVWVASFTGVAGGRPRGSYSQAPRGRAAVPSPARTHLITSTSSYWKSSSESSSRRLSSPGPASADMCSPPARWRPRWCRAGAAGPVELAWGGGSPRLGYFGGCAVLVLGDALG